MQQPAETSSKTFSRYESYTWPNMLIRPSFKRKYHMHVLICFCVKKFFKTNRKPFNCVTMIFRLSLSSSGLSTWGERWNWVRPTLPAGVYWVTLTGTNADWWDRVLTWVVAHISIIREPGDVETLRHGGVPIFTVLAIVKNVVHGCSGHIFNWQFTLKRMRKVLIHVGENHSRRVLIICK